MKKLSIIIIFSVFFVGSFIGCVSGPQPGPYFSGLHDGKQGYSAVYLYRPYHEIKSGVWPEVYINDIKAMGLINKGYTIIYLKPGTYKISTEKSAFYTDMGINILYELKVRRGQTIFLKYDLKFHVVTYPYRSGYVTTRRTSFSKIHEKWTEMGKNQGLKEIKRCRYVLPYKEVF